MIRLCFINILFYFAVAQQFGTAQRKTGDISSEKCREYAKYAVGESTTPNSNSETLNRRDFPHVAAIGFQRQNDITWACGGTLISEEYILTAAHCLKNPITGDLPKFVLLGVTSLDDQSENRQQIEILSVISHPEYKAKHKLNDLGLIKLQKPVKFDINTHPACLNTKSEISGGNVVNSGFATSEIGGKQSRELEKVDLDILTREECNSNPELIKAFERLNASKDIEISDSKICTKPHNNGKDLCQGSGGSPVHLPHDSNKDNIHRMNDLIGIISFGGPCGSNTIPTLSTRVSKYIKWIEDIVWPVSECICTNK